MQQKERIVRNAIAGLLTPLLPLFVSFFMMPFIIDRVGKDAFGIWALSISLIGYAGLLDVGFLQTTVREVAEYIALDNKQDLKDFCSRMFILYILLGLITGIGFYIFTKYYFTTVFNIPADLEAEAKLAMYIIGIQAALSFPARLWEGIIQGMQKFTYNMLLVVIFTGLQATLIYILLLRGYGLVALAVITFVTTFFRWLAYFIYVSLKLPQANIYFSKELIRKKEFTSIISFSIYFFILQASAMVILQTDRVLVGIYFPIAAVTTYEVALRIHDVIRKIVASVQMIILPASTELYVLRRDEYLRQIVLKGTKYVYILFFLIAVPAAVLGKPFITWWVGEDLAIAYQILIVLLIAQMFNALNFITGQVFLGMWKVKVYVWVRIISALLNIILSIIFLHIFGLIGVALGTAVQFAVTDVPLLLYFLGQLSIRRLEFFRKCLLSTIPSAIFAGSVLGSYAYLIDWTNQNVALQIIGGCLIYGFLYLLLLWKIGCNIEERKEIISLVLSLKKNIF